MEIVIKGSLVLEGATILNPALVCKITSSSFKMGQFSSIMYGDKSLWLNVTGSFNISGNIYPFNLNYGEAGTTPTVYIIAGVQPDGSDSPQGTHSFVIHSTSSVIGNSIQIFTDEDMIIKGNLNNYYRDRDNEWRIVRSCRLGKHPSSQLSRPRPLHTKRCLQMFASVPHYYVTFFVHE